MGLLQGQAEICRASIRKGVAEAATLGWVEDAAMEHGTSSLMKEFKKNWVDNCSDAGTILE